MSNSQLYFRCPCCNEPLDDWEVSMYDVFEGMREECFKESMKACYDDGIMLNDLDLDMNNY